MNLLVSIIAAEDPSQTHSWIWPEGAELIYGTISSLLVFFLLYKYGWPPAKKAFAARTARIQKQMDDAEAAKRGAEAAADDIRSKLGDIQAERARLLADADATAEQVLAQGRLRLDDEVAGLEARAAADVDASRSRVAGEVQAEVATMAGETAELIVRRRLDDRLQSDLVEQYIANVGSARS